VAFPLQTVFDVELSEQLAHVAVSAEEDVQTGFIPVTVVVLPGRHLAAEHITGFVHHRRVAGIHQIFGAGKTGQTGTDDGDAHGGPGNRLQPYRPPSPAARWGGGARLDKGARP
jgi:hypothetical protein